MIIKKLSDEDILKNNEFREWIQTCKSRTLDAITSWQQDVNEVTRFLEDLKTKGCIEHYTVIQYSNGEVDVSIKPVMPIKYINLDIKLIVEN